MQWAIRPFEKSEYPLLEDFLYHAIFVPQGICAPPRSIVERPELRVYLDGFGGRCADRALAADLDGKIVGAVWVRIMDDYGHIDDRTPSFAISVLPEWRGHGIGTALMREMLDLLRADGYTAASLSVQKENSALRLYLRLGFEPLHETEEEYIMICRF